MLTKRFIIFVEYKKLYFENKKVFEAIYFEPNKIFNEEGFLVACSLVMIFYEILYIIFPDKCHRYEASCNYEKKYTIFDESRNKRIFILFLLLIITYTLCGIFDTLYDFEIKKRLKMINDKWEIKPIKSIKINFNENEIDKIITKNNKNIFYEFNTNFFELERLPKFDYYNIYRNENGKICGKDSFGNILYFPEDIECPINDIIITNYNNTTNLEDYEKIFLGNNSTYLYYTNKKIQNKILIDINVRKTRDHEEINLNRATKEICYDLFYEKDDCKLKFFFEDSPFYISINNWTSEDFLKIGYDEDEDGYYSWKNIYLYPVTYLGINSTIIKK